MAADRRGIATEGTGNTERAYCTMTPTEGDSTSLTRSARGAYQISHCEKFGLPRLARRRSEFKDSAGGQRRWLGEGCRLGRNPARPRGGSVDGNGGLPHGDARLGGGRLALPCLFSLFASVQKFSVS